MRRNDPLLTLPKAIKKATGQTRSTATCHRWRLKGINGVCLETCKVGGRRLTTVAAVHRFIEMTTAVADGNRSPKPRTSRQQEAAIRQAELALKRAGGNQQSEGQRGRKPPRGKPDK